MHRHRHQEQSTGTIITEYTSLIPEDLLQKLIVQSTPLAVSILSIDLSAATIDKNLKLALQQNKSVIIETRGESGYFCTSKINNSIMRGYFDMKTARVLKSRRSRLKGEIFFFGDSQKPDQIFSNR